MLRGSANKVLGINGTMRRVKSRTGLAERAISGETHLQEVWSWVDTAFTRLEYLGFLSAGISQG